MNRRSIPFDQPWFQLLLATLAGIASAFTEGEVLQVLFVSCLFGMAVAMGEKWRPITDALERLSAAFFKIIHFLMYLSPIGGALDDKKLAAIIGIARARRAVGTSQSPHARGDCGRTSVRPPALPAVPIA